MSELTSKQQRVFDYLSVALARDGAPPTRAEIAEALGFASANAAQAHLHTLARKGFIELGSHRSRGIRIIADDDQTAPAGTVADDRLAVIGRVAAGAPMLAVEHVERRVRVDTGLFPTRPDYLLTVRGDSMTGAGILDGDLLGVKHSDTVRTGQIAVFRIDDDVTVKRFFRNGKQVRLAAENPAYDDIRVDPERDTLTVEGIAVGVIRTLP